MSREYQLFLKDMRAACEKALRFTKGLTREQFLANEEKFDAVMRNLEIIGEAAKRIPPEVRRQYPGIDWSKVAGLRGVVIQQYFGLDVDILWDIITQKLPALHEQLARIT